MAFMAYAFNLNVENCGNGVKIGLFHVQGAHIAKQDVRQSCKTNNGKTCYNGPIMHNKGDTYLIECNVTGSGKGTSDKPKFSLLTLFRENMFPKVNKHVVPGWKYEGYLPIFQCDNTGPHINSTFNFITSTCSTRGGGGGYWEPQTPQMPHVNLAIFPTMSK